MSNLLLYTCPNCEANCSVAPDLVRLNVVCPSCEQEFTATPRDLAFDFQPSANVPFFKSGKLEILKNYLNKLISDGELSISDEIAKLVFMMKKLEFRGYPVKIQSPFLTIGLGRISVWLGILLFLVNSAVLMQAQWPSQPFLQLIYKTNNNQIEVTGFKASVDAGRLVIPETISGLPVTKINDKALENSLFYEIKISDSVTFIGSKAFASSYQITSFSIPRGVTNIGVSAFERCFQLTNINVDLNNAVFSSEDGVLFDKQKKQLIQFPEGKSALNTWYSIPGGVTTIMERAFYDSRLTTIVIGGVTKINQFAFIGCFNLRRVDIPSSVTSIGDSVFFDCRNLESFWVNSSNLSYKSQNGVLFNKSGSELVTYPANRIGSYYDVSNSVVSIKDSAFAYADNLTRITIPSSVLNIGNSVFSQCYRLQSITIPNGVTSIGDFAFSYCAGLTNISLPNTITNIGFGAFTGCKSLTSIRIPASVASIGGSAFENCTRLASITIPSGVTSIQNRAFYGCSNLTSLPIPVGVTSIMESAFENCGGLTNISMPNGVNRIGNSAFQRCKDLTNIKIPNGVTTIGSNAFESCYRLTQITIPSGVTKIGDRTFQNCRSLTNISISTNVDSIGGSAFFNCTGLASITIPNSVTIIGGYAFSYCAGLTNISLPNTITNIGFGAFQGCKSLTSIRIPIYIGSIGARLFEDCSTLTSITIPNGVTSIGGAAFQNCGNLETISIPNSVTIIADSAFRGCKSLTNIMIPIGVTKILYKAFGSCSQLANIYFLGDAPYFDPSAFSESNQVIVYFTPGSKGWTDTFVGRPTKMWVQQPQPRATNLGFKSGQFGFDITAMSGQPFVIEAATNVVQPVWKPLSTNTAINGTSSFIDPQWEEYPTRLYRTRVP